MFLIFSLGRPDVLPVDDLGFRAGVRRHYGLDALPTAAALRTLAEPWRPYRTFATRSPRPAPMLANPATDGDASRSNGALYARYAPPSLSHQRPIQPQRPSRPTPSSRRKCPNRHICHNCHQYVGPLGPLGPLQAPVRLPGRGPNFHCAQPPRPRYSPFQHRR
jgi:hypothetical protein